MKREEILDNIKNLNDFIGSNSNKKLDDDVIICECFCVNVADIKATKLKKVDFEYLKNSLGLGTGCSSCIKSKNNWKEKIF